MTQHTEQNKAQILIIVGILFSLGMSMTLSQVPFIRDKSDIYLRWYATTKLLTEDRNLYDERNGEEVMQLVYGNKPLRQTTNFYYPAHLLLFTAPLAFLPYPVAHIIWTTAVQLFYLAALWLLIRHLHWPGTANQVTLFLLTATLFLPYLQHTIWGQFNTVGVLSLVLSYLALRQEKDSLAGMWAVGLTFKPQTTLLLLLFLLAWALWQRRWRFLLGFILTSLAMWSLAEFLQPGWVWDFINSLESYIPVRSAVDQIWNPFQLTTIGLLLVAGAIFIKNRNVPATSAAFAGCLAFNIATWTLVIPIAGMLHIVIFPATFIMLLASLKKCQQGWYHPVLLLLFFVYLAGWVSFLWGLTDQALYDQHILWPELIYKAILPILTALLSLPFCLRSRYRMELI